jgi:hypothetical protein
MAKMQMNWILNIKGIFREAVLQNEVAKFSTRGQKEYFNTLDALMAAWYLKLGIFHFI